MLSNKILYPAFFRTIPSDKNQVAAMIQLLVRYNWTWIALLGSDNAYGLEGMKSLSQQAPDHGICIAYQGIIPSYRSDTIPTMRNMVEHILTTKVNTIVVFSSKSKLRGFFPFVVERNMTDKVWIGTEDWSVATLISEIDGIHTIGTVLGVPVKYAALPGFQEFERKIFEASIQHSNIQNVTSGNVCLQSTDLYSLAKNNFSLESYDITSSFNVYKAVYAVAHALHQALSCDSERCRRRRVHPWQVFIKIFVCNTNISEPLSCFKALIFSDFSPSQLLSLLKQVRFSLGNTSVYFDGYGDPPTGYDIVTWVWRGTDWSLRVVGSFTPDPITLTVKEDEIEWHHTRASTSVRPLWNVLSSECCLLLNTVLLHTIYFPNYFAFHLLKSHLLQI